MRSCVNTKKKREREKKEATSPIKKGEFAEKTGDVTTCPGFKPPRPTKIKRFF
jgi:hypothetical protein